MTSALTSQQWLPILEGLATDARVVAAPLLQTSAGGTEVGTVGAGGDRTLEVDRRSEEAMLAGLRELAHRGMTFSVLSEEAGLVDLGADYPRGVIDPIDGSPIAARATSMPPLVPSLMPAP